MLQNEDAKRGPRNVDILRYRRKRAGPVLAKISYRQIKLR